MSKANLPSSVVSGSSLGLTAAQIAGDLSGTSAMPEVLTVLNGRTPEHTDNKGAVNGYMGLDSSGIGTQPPKAHAQTMHGRGGTDTLLNGLEVSDASTQQANHTFIFGPRTTTTLAFPVPTFQSKVATLPMALDIAPGTGAVTPSNNNGYAWIDICDQDVIDETIYNGFSLRLANQGTFGEISTRLFGTPTHNSGSAIPIYIGSAYSGSGNPQIYLSPMSGSYPSIILGYDGSSVFAGTNAAIATSSTKGFLHIPTCAGAPTATPHYTNQPAIVFDSTNNKLWIYNGSWKGVVVS
jgi:hypothetical protein